MKKLVAFIVLITLLFTGKCYYQKSKINSFLESLKEYGYSYDIKNSSICSMDISLKIEDINKIFNFYPKFIRESRLFKKEVLKGLKKSNIKAHSQVYHVTMPIFSFSVVATNTYRYSNNSVNLKSSFSRFLQHLSDKKLIKSTTTCSVLTNRCVSVYSDIDTTYDEKHLVAKGITANIIYKNIDEIKGDFVIEKFLLVNGKSEFDVDNIKVEYTYNNNENFLVEEVVSAKSLRIKDKYAVEGKFKDIALGFGYKEDDNAFLNISAKNFNLPSKELDIDLENFNIAIDISNKSGYKFNIDKVAINDKNQNRKYLVQNILSAYKFLDNNIFLANGKTTLKSFNIEDKIKGNQTLKNIELISNPTINKDKLNLKESYLVGLIDLNIDSKKFKLKDAKIELEVKEIGYLVIKDLYNEIKEIYKKNFKAAFNGEVKTKDEIKKEVKKVTTKYMPRYVEILQYGIKVDLNKLSFKELVVDNKVAKNLDADAHLVLNSVTMNDIIGKKYTKEKLPIKSLKGVAKIPNSLFEIAQIPTASLPFKLEDKGEFKVINLSFKDGNLYINGEIIK